MKKFLAVFDGYHFSESTLAYALQLSKQADALLTGVFLDERIYHNHPVVAVLSKGKKGTEAFQEIQESEKKKRDEAVILFEKACQQAGLRYRIHRDTNIALQELKHESMFADLLIIQRTETFTRYKEEAPTRFIKDLLGSVQCPAIVVSAVCKPIDKILLLYDGKPASLFAIKSFSYLFSGMKDIVVEVFCVKDHYMPSLNIPDNDLMREFISRHFPGAIYTVQKGIPEEVIVQYIENHTENELVILGSYRRSELSRLLKPSMADLLMKTTETPLFIAHS